MARTRIGGEISGLGQFRCGMDLWMAFYCSPNESRVLLTNKKTILGAFTLHNALNSVILASTGEKSQ